MGWLDDFRDPPAEYRPVPFWSWNGRMTPAEVRRQVDVIADAGWGGGFIHSRVGLTTPYLGEEWFAAVDATLEACRARGLPVWLYDEDRWPSGFSGGTVTREHPEHRSCYIAALEPKATLPPDSEVIGERDGVRLIVGREPLGSPLFNGATYLDPLNPAAVAKFLDDAYEPYHQRYGDDFGGLIRAVFTDEPAPLSLHSRLPIGALPYTPDLPEEFAKRHGEPLADKLHLLFADGPGAATFRLRYARLVSDLFEQRFTRALGDWCENRGVALTGHWMSDHNCRDPQRMAFRPMPQYRHQQIPGIDHLGRQIEEVLAAKVASSAAHQQSKPRVLSELFGVAGQSLSFEDRHWIALQQIVLGVNLLVPHLALYTMAGCRKRDYPPNLFEQQPWWPMNRVLDDRLSRLCVAMSQGKYLADAAVIHPQESAALLWQSAQTDGTIPELHHHGRHTSKQSWQALTDLDAKLQDLLTRLLDDQVGFDFVDEGDELQATADGLRVGAMVYPQIVLPPLATLRPSTFAVLRQLGGRVWRDFGDDQAVPLDGEPSDELNAWLRTLPRLDCLPTRVVADTTGGRLLTHLRDVGDERLLLAVNLHRTETVEGTVAVTGWHVAAELDLASGERRDAEPFALLPASGRLFVLKPDDREPATRPIGATAEPIEVTDIRVTALDDNALPLDHVLHDGRRVPVLAVKQMLDAEQFIGPLTLRYPVRIDAVPPRCRLVVEDGEAWRVNVNGQPITFDGNHWLDCRFRTADVAALLTAGENIIETSGNFIFGDPGAAENARRYGTEPEAIYLVGDFGVAGKLGPGRVAPRWDELGLPPVVTHELHEPQIVRRSSLSIGDVVPQGLPFYAGRLRLSFDAPAAGTLELQHMDAAVAEVRLDGEPIGHLIHRPWQVPVAGPGRVDVTIFGTLRNLLGPHHHPHGEMPHVGPHSFLPELRDDQIPATTAWVRRGTPPPPGTWHDGYCLIGFGGIGRVTLTP